MQNYSLRDAFKSLDELNEEFIETSIVINGPLNEDFVEDSSDVDDHESANIRVFDIHWDSYDEYDEDAVKESDIPSEMYLELDEEDLHKDSDELEQIIADELSDQTGWLVSTFKYERLEPEKILEQKEPLKEETFSLTTEEGLKDIEEFKEEDENEQPELTVVDTNADKIDEVASNEDAAGSFVFTCDKCGENIFRTLDELQTDGYERVDDTLFKLKNKDESQGEFYHCTKCGNDTFTGNKQLVLADVDAEVNGTTSEEEITSEEDINVVDETSSEPDVTEDDTDIVVEESLDKKELTEAVENENSDIKNLKVTVIDLDNSNSVTTREATIGDLFTDDDLLFDEEDDSKIFLEKLGKTKLIVVLNEANDFDSCCILDDGSILDLTGNLGFKLSDNIDSFLEDHGLSAETVEQIKAAISALSEKDSVIESTKVSEDDIVEDFLSDRVAKVLDDAGILYGDIVEYPEHKKCNIVGVPYTDWEEAKEAIESELGLRTIIPEDDRTEFDDEIEVFEESLLEALSAEKLAEFKAKDFFKDFTDNAIRKFISIYLDFNGGSDKVVTPEEVESFMTEEGLGLFALDNLEALRFFVFKELAKKDPKFIEACVKYYPEAFEDKDEDELITLTFKDLSPEQLDDTRENVKKIYLELDECVKKIKEGFVRRTNGTPECSNDGENWEECSLEEFDELKAGGYKDVSEPVDEFDELSITDIEEESLDKAISEKLSAIYENFGSYKTTSAFLKDVENRIILEGKLTFTSNKEQDVKFILEALESDNGSIKFKLTCEDFEDINSELMTKLNEGLLEAQLDEASTAEKRALLGDEQDRVDVVQGKAIARIKDPAARDAAIAAIKAGRPEVAAQFYGSRKAGQADVELAKKFAKMQKAGLTEADVGDDWKYPEDCSSLEEYDSDAVSNIRYKAEQGLFDAEEISENDERDYENDADGYIASMCARVAWGTGSGNPAENKLALDFVEKEYPSKVKVLRKYLGNSNSTVK